MKRLRNLTVAFFLISLVLVAGDATDAQESASMQVTPESIVWHPLVSNGGISLSLTGPGGVHNSYSYEANASPSIGLADAEGNLFPDGQYSYELRFTPVTGTLTRQDIQTDAAPSEKELLPQSGSFNIIGGRFLASPADKELSSLRTQSGSGTITPDQVIAEALIVQGSLCVGGDCIDGEAFGFDTIRLKENNLRIKFEDTSTGTFPTNDWQITANDSGSGGANYLAFEDITGVKIPFKILAGAATNSLYIDSTGRVGLRTATPVLDLHINTSNTPAVRLEQNSSGGFTAQTWDIAGNEANFFIRDVTGGSRLPFRIRPGAPTSSIDISASGNVGIGTASPQTKLHVMGTLTLDAVAQSSSRTYKDNILALTAEDAMKTLKGLVPVTFSYKRDPGQQHTGFIAEEVPETIANPERTAILPLDIVAVLTKVVQEQDRKLAEQQSSIEELKRELASLKKHGLQHKRRNKE